MSFDPEKITFFGQTDARGKHVPFGIKAKDRARHMYVIGKTGMGKSTMLENMAVQDIQNGEGLAFIDPHGSTAEKLLSYVPEHRIDDVVYFAPFDMNYPISFNVMEDVGADRRHLVVSGLMSTFKKIWVDAWSARMEYILTNTLLALLEYPGSTLLSVSQMLADKNYRRKVVDNIKDPAVRSFWVDEFANYTERFAAEATPAIQNKIGQFTGNPLIRNIVGQPKSSFDIREIMDEKKILIMNLSKGLVGETNANLLGSMLTTRIYLAAMSRADLTPQQMKAAPNFYFYVDEFQSFANSTFADILSEARKYKLNLTIAHQYIEQMEEEVKNAVFGNVGTTVAFRVGPFDAEVLETVFTPKFVAADLVNLGFAQIYLTLMIDGIGSQPFSAVTLPPIEEPHISYKDVVTTASRKHYAHNRVDVEKQVNKLMVSEQAELSNARIAREKAKANGTYKKPDTPFGSADTTQQSHQRTTTERPRQAPREFRSERTTGADDRKPAQNPATFRRGGDGRSHTNTSAHRNQEHARTGKKDLGELRAILKGMSTDQKKKESDEPKTQSPSATPAEKNEKKKPQKESPAKHGLRDVLAQMKVESKETTPSAASSKVQTAQKETVQRRPQKEGVPKQTAATPRAPHAPTPATPQRHTTQKRETSHTESRSSTMPRKRSIHVSPTDAVTVKRNTAQAATPTSSPKAVPAAETAPPRRTKPRPVRPSVRRTSQARHTDAPPAADHSTASASRAGATPEMHATSQQPQPPRQRIPKRDTPAAPAPATEDASATPASVSPKELERMMRVTTSDTPPFK